jgi:hypothetical protein
MSTDTRQGRLRGAHPPMSTFATSGAVHKNTAGLCSPGWY